jgi:hypothetical protein
MKRIKLFLLLFVFSCNYSCYAQKDIPTQKQEATILLEKNIYKIGEVIRITYEIAGNFSCDSLKSNFNDFELVGKYNSLTIVNGVFSSNYIFKLKANKAGKAQITSPIFYGKKMQLVSKDTSVTILDEPLTDKEKEIEQEKNKKTLDFWEMTQKSSDNTEIKNSAIQKAFDNYKSAVLNNNGEEAVRYINNKTLEYYGYILDKVKTANKSEVNKLSIFYKITILSIRHRIPKEEILSFDNRKLFIYLINHEMVGKSSFAENSIAQIIITGNFALAKILAGDKLSPYSLQFQNENGQWKIDLTSLSPLVSVEIEKKMKESGYNENKFIFSILTNLTGRKPDKKIWKPIK